MHITYKEKKKKPYDVLIKKKIKKNTCLRVFGILDFMYAF